MDHYYKLKSNVAAIPTIGSWYAWPLLIPPHSFCRFLANYYLKIVESYITNPLSHENALKLEHFKGGPFINRPREDYDKIKIWYDSYKMKYDLLINLNKDLEYFETEVMNKYTGQRLDSIYEILPNSLKGRVECFYNRSNVLAYRFIEPFYYQSEFYHSDLQGIKLLQINSDKRDFSLTTPQIRYNDNELIINIPFKSKILDRLFSNDLTSVEINNIAEDFKLNKNDSNLFKDFFEIGSSQKKRAIIENTIHYLGHAALLIKTTSQVIMLDPVLSYDGYLDSNEISRYTYEDLPDKIDYVFITHNHQDHILLESLLRIRSKIGSIVIPKSCSNTLEDPSLRLILKECGFNNIIELSEFEEITEKEFKIQGIPFIGEHGDLINRTKLAYAITVKDKKILCAADSTNEVKNLYSEVFSLIGKIDHLFIGMECEGAPVSWLYGPLFTKKLAREHDQTRRLKGSNFSQAKEIVENLKADNVYIYAMGQEPWLGNVMHISYTDESLPIIESNKLIEYVKNMGKSCERLYLSKEISI